MLRVRLGTGSDLSYGLDTCLIGAIFSQKNSFVIRKALMNMAIDADPTRWAMSGFELERGVVLSHDTAFFAHRASRIHEDLPGNIFFIPQFGFVDEDIEFTIPKLWQAKEAENLKKLAKLRQDRVLEEKIVMQEMKVVMSSTPWWKFGWHLREA